MGMWGCRERQKTLGMKDILVGATTYCPAPFFCSRVCISATKINSKFSVFSVTCKEVKERSLRPEKSHVGKVARGCAQGCPYLSRTVQESPGPPLRSDRSFPQLTFLLRIPPADPSSGPGHSATETGRSGSTWGRLQKELAQPGLSTSFCLKILSI